MQHGQRQQRRHTLSAIARVQPCSSGVPNCVELFRITKERANEAGDVPSGSTSPTRSAVCKLFFEPHSGSIAEHVVGAPGHGLVGIIHE